METHECNPKFLRSSIPVYLISCIIASSLLEKCDERIDVHKSQHGSVCRFASCWCSLSHKLPSWVLEWATMFQSKRMIQHNWFGTLSSRTSEECWCFLRKCGCFEDSEDSLYTLGELQQYLKYIFEVEHHMYSTRWIKSKIIERYGKEHVIFIKICERRNVVCFRKMTNHIINDKWYSDKKSSIEEESVRIVKYAARLIKDSICKVHIISASL